MQESLFIGKPIIEPLEPMDEDSDYPAEKNNQEDDIYKQTDHDQ